MFGYMMVILAGCSGALFGACYKIRATRGYPVVYFLLIFSISSLFLSFIFMMIFQMEQNWNVKSFVPGFSYGFFIAVSMFFYMKTVSFIRLGIGWMFIQMSVVIPFLFSLLYFHETISRKAIVGLFLISGAVILMGIGKRSKGQTPRWAIAGFILSVLCTGIAQCFPKLYVESGWGSNPLMLITLSRISMVVIFFLLLRLDRGSEVSEKKVYGCKSPGLHRLSVLMGIAGTLLPFFLIVGLKYIPGTIAYPLITMVSILVVLIISRLIYHEHFSVWEKAGFLIALTGIAVLI